MQEMKYLIKSLKAPHRGDLQNLILEVKKDE